MLDPEGAETHQDDLLARVRDLVEKGGGTWRSHDAWGRRRLAYPIAKKAEGVYHLVVFEAGAETLDEISRVLKIDDGVLRHMATKHIEGSKTSAPRDDPPRPRPGSLPRNRAPPRRGGVRDGRGGVADGSQHQPRRARRQPDARP